MPASTSALLPGKPTTTTPAASPKRGGDGGGGRPQTRTPSGKKGAGGVETASSKSPKGGSKKKAKGGRGEERGISQAEMEFEEAAQRRADEIEAAEKAKDDDTRRKDLRAQEILENRRLAAERERDEAAQAVSYFTCVFCVYVILKCRGRALSCCV